MPIRVQDELPAVNFLREENVFVMTASRATGQEIRPLKVLILNLMPKKIETENQFLRLLSNSPLQVDIQLLRIDARESRNTPSEHLNNFYCNFDDIQGENFDGLIVTGAPLGLVEFNDVAYWPQIKQVLEWAKDHVTSTLFVCWAVQAALNILYGIPKQTRTEKLSGVYEHHILHPHALLTRGFDDSFLAPHSRYADFPAQLIRDYTDLEILVGHQVRLQKNGLPQGEWQTESAAHDYFPTGHRENRKGDFGFAHCFSMMRAVARLLR